MSAPVIQLLPHHKFLVRVPGDAGSWMLISSIVSILKTREGAHLGPHKNPLPVATVIYRQPGPGPLRQTLRLTRRPRPSCHLPTPRLVVHPKWARSSIWSRSLPRIFTVPYPSCRQSRLLPPLHAAIPSVTGVQLSVLIEDPSAKGARRKRAIRQ